MQARDSDRLVFDLQLSGVCARELDAARTLATLADAPQAQLPGQYLQAVERRRTDRSLPVPPVARPKRTVLSADALAVVNHLAAVAAQGKHARQDASACAQREEAALARLLHACRRARPRALTLPQSSRLRLV